jgi:hypothetical protein
VVHCTIVDIYLACEIWEVGLEIMSGSIEEGASVTRLPLLKNTNYFYWKTRIEILIKTLDTGGWKAVLKG